MIDGLLDNALEGVLEGALKGVLNNLCKDAQEANVVCEGRQNFVNMLNFQLFFIMLNLSMMQAISKGSVG